MNICSKNGSIEIETSDINFSIDINRALSGFGAELAFPDTQGAFYLCTHTERNPFRFFIVCVPSTEWENDIKDEGYEIHSMLVMPELKEENENPNH